MIKPIFTSATMLLASLAATAAMAASPVQLSSEIFVEKMQKRADGSSAVTLLAPKLIVPGDQLVFVVRYKNVGAQAATGFTVTNPLPKAVAFSGTSDGNEIVSIDGGQNWGKLSQLSIKQAGGKARPALMTDVTHLKWNMNQPLTAGAEGKLIFRGVVR
jgi:uncharacterized repeat protein (TIGR01451 family)